MSSDHESRRRDHGWDVLLAAGIIWVAVDVPWQLEFGAHQRTVGKVVSVLVTLLFAVDLWIRWRHLFSRGGGGER